MTIDWNEGIDPELPLATLGAGTPGISPVFGSALSEAASVCLHEQGHSSPTPMNVRGVVSVSTLLRWSSPTDQASRSWADPDVATEWGAYGIATLLMPALSPLTVVERSKKGTGFDFWLGEQNSTSPLFQDKARLEVSGIRQGSASTVSGRMKKKLRQVDKSAGALPAVIVIVEFGDPKSQLAEK